jgi:hypothetical protein
MRRQEPSYIPLHINSSATDLVIDSETLYWYPWISELRNKNTWLSLSTRWNADGSLPVSPPAGYEYYIVSGDSLMFEYAEKVAKETGGQVVFLTGPLISSDLSTDQVSYLPYTSDHRRIRRIPDRWTINKNIQYKASALTNRVTQSKVIIFSALKTLLGDDVVGSLNHAHALAKNVHHWQMTGNPVCDTYSKIFIENWLDKYIKLDHDDNIEGSYNNPAYQNSALNFTQESYHYSYMICNGRHYIEPGPFLTEKTWKCLLSQTAFIPVGQYQSYTWLEQIGFEFDYGPLDLSFDQDPGNMTRLEKIVQVIESLQHYTAMDIYQFTKKSCEKNYDHARSDKLWNLCEDHNQGTVNKLVNL